MSFTKHISSDIQYFTAQNLSSDNKIAHAFSTRCGGVSKAPFNGLNLGRSRNDDPLLVRQNYQLFSKATNCDITNIVMAQQVHSDTVVVVTERDAFQDLYSPTTHQADALVTNTPHLTLAVFYADCVPILLYDPVQHVIAAVHSGWRGTAKHITGRTIETMQSQFNSQIRDIRIAIGPSIGACCFETHADVPTAMQEALGDSILPYISFLGHGKYRVDLNTIITHCLTSMGVLEEHINCLNLCTTCHPTLFWSHRSMGEARGNQCAMIQIKN